MSSRVSVTCGAMRAALARCQAVYASGQASSPDMPSTGTITQAHTSVLHTGAAAALRGFKVIVPVDAVSADNAYIEQYVAYNFTSAPSVAAATTLTRASMIKF